MAFKRSSVRSRLSPPNHKALNTVQGFFVTMMSQLRNTKMGVSLSNHTKLTRHKISKKTTALLIKCGRFVCYIVPIIQRLFLALSHQILTKTVNLRTAHRVSQLL